VIGSSGSVVELMRESIRAGQRIAITDPDATRYFMTAGEAVALVLRADLLGRAPEIFWLDMGDPVRLGDLVDRLIASEARAGHAVAGVDVIGLRPGEKRNETLTDPQLTFHRTIDRRILVARERTHLHASLETGLRRLTRAGMRADDTAALTGLADLLATFKPSAHAKAAARRSSVVAPSARGAAARRRGRAA
jgi:FlaA1/EpsC-like NDP-sugar epimerase